MGQKDNKARANKFLQENDKILSEVKKLCQKYRYNHTIAKRLYKRDKIDRAEWPNDLDGDGWLGDRI